MVVRPGPFALEEARIAVELAMASVRAWPWVVHRVLSATGLPHDVIDLILRVAFQPAPTAALVASVYRSAWERVQHRAQMVALLQPATPPALRLRYPWLSSAGFICDEPTIFARPSPQSLHAYAMRAFRQRA